MKTALSLWVDEEIKRKAKALAKARGISVSQMFSELIDRESKRNRDPFEKLDGIWSDRDIDTEKIRREAWRCH